MRISTRLFRKARKIFSAQAEKWLLIVSESAAYFFALSTLSKMRTGKGGLYAKDQKILAPTGYALEMARDARAEVVVYHAIEVGASGKTTPERLS